MFNKITVNAFDVAGDFMSIDVPKYFDKIDIITSAKDMDSTPEFLMVIHIAGEEDIGIYFKDLQAAQVEKIRLYKEKESDE